MSNSTLVNVTVLSPNHSGTRTKAIDRITPHCVVGQLTAEAIGNCFVTSKRKASCNYGIGTDGKVVLVVDESNRSWCSSNSSNDQRAVTIECASDKTNPYAMTNEVYSSLIALCVDVCKRNNKRKLLWFDDKDKTLSYIPASDEMIITVHRWFAKKECPGDWLYERLGDLARTVTERLIDQVSTEKPNDVTKTTNFQEYKVKVTTNALNIRKGAGITNAVVGTIRDKGIYTIVSISEDEKWGKLKSGIGWIALAYTKRI